MCYARVSKFASCGHSEVKHTPCPFRSSQFSRATICIPRETTLEINGECSDCRESFIRAAEAFPQAAKSQAASSQTLFAWPENAKRLETQASTKSQSPPLRDSSSNCIPEDGIAARENRSLRSSSLSSVLEKALPNLPAPSDTPQVHRTATSRAEPARFSTPHGGSRPTAQSKPRPHADRTGHRLKTKDRTDRLRDDFQQTEDPHVPDAAPSIRPKSLPATAADHILHPSKTPMNEEVAEYGRDARKAKEAWEKVQTGRAHHGSPLAHTKSKESFLTTPERQKMAEADMEMTPVCLRAGNVRQMKSLSRVSMIFDRSIMLGEENATIVTHKPSPTTTTTTPGTSETKSTSELSAHFDMTCGSLEGKSIELEARSCRTTPPRTEKSGRMSGRVSTVGLWNAYTTAKPAEMEPIPELP